MGRSYWFECSKCGYRATVSGRTDRGHDFAVQTVACRECKKLFDVVVRLRVPDEPPPFAAGLKPLSLRRRPGLSRVPSKPPGFQAALNRLPVAANRSHWVSFRPQCPVSGLHRIDLWNEGGRCPRCSVRMERTALPYRLWD